MAYVNVPNDLSKIKTKIAFNLTKRQLICFGSAAVVGIPAYLLTMYERDGLPLEKVARNVIRARFLWPRTRPYQTRNFYACLSNPRKEVQQLDTKKAKATRPKHGA